MVTLFSLDSSKYSFSSSSFGIFITCVDCLAMMLIFNYRNQIKVITDTRGLCAGNYGI